MNIDSGPISSCYVEYILLSVIVKHTVLFLGKGRCPLSTVRVIGCPVDDMTFTTSPVNFIFIEYNDIVLKMQSFCVCSMPSNLDDENFLHQLWNWKDAAAFKLSLKDGYGDDSDDRYIFKDVWLDNYLVNCKLDMAGFESSLMRMYSNLTHSHCKYLFVCPSPESHYTYILNI